MAPFAESRNFSDSPKFGKLRRISDSENGSRTSSMNADDWGWWSSKTSLEQKLIIFTAILSILCFCLIITVIVLDNRKCSAGSVTTAAPTNESTSPASVSEPTKPTEPPTEPPTPPPTTPPTNATESPENAAETRPPEPLKEKEEKKGEVVPAA